MIEKNVKQCSFFGHRNIEITDDLKQKLKVVVEDLIIKNNVYNFLFGSRSNFDSLCRLVVTELKEKYENIKRIVYTCKSESCILETERTEWEYIYSKLQKQPIHLIGVEQEVEHKTKYISGKASYVERNYAMINDSDFCVFYYDDKYMPDIRKRCKKSIWTYQPKSGTSLAYNYAKQKNIPIINLFYNQSVDE